MTHQYSCNMAQKNYSLGRPQLSRHSLGDLNAYVCFLRLETPNEITGYLKETRQN